MLNREKKNKLKGHLFCLIALEAKFNIEELNATIFYFFWFSVKEKIISFLVSHDIFFTNNCMSIDSLILVIVNRSNKSPISTL